MTLDAWIVMAVVAGAVALFVTERYPIEQVAMAVPVVLLSAGVLELEQAVAGLSSPATVTVAAMLVMSLGLKKTGAVAVLGRWARTAPLGGPGPRLIVLCTIVAAISPFLNNTAVVVVFLPIFIGMARGLGESPSRYLIPLSYCAILGGTVTLIGTSTNLIVYGLAEARGYRELSMFSVTPLGIAFVLVGLVYLFTVGRRLLPDRETETARVARYDVRDFVTELAVPAGSRVVGRTLEQLRLRELYGVQVLGVHREGHTSWSPPVGRALRQGDELFVRGDREPLLRLVRHEGLRMPAYGTAGQAAASGGRLVEVLVTPGSSLIGHTLREVRFRQRYGATVVAIQHHRTTVEQRLADRTVELGDLLLLHGRPADLEGIADLPGFSPLAEVKSAREDRPHALMAVGILTGVVAAAGTGLVAIEAAALVGVVLMLFTGCVRTDEIYDELDWMVVFLLAGLVPLGIAMEETGAAGEIATWAAVPLAAWGPRAAVAGLYLVTGAFTELMSNAATAVVLTPVALSLAEQLGMNPYALLVTVMFAASASFLSPVGYQTNALVYAPGGYRFRDFTRVGAPLHLLLLGVAVTLIPVLWPS